MKKAKTPRRAVAPRRKPKARAARRPRMTERDAAHAIALLVCGEYLQETKLHEVDLYYPVPISLNVRRSDIKFALEGTHPEQAALEVIAKAWR